MKVPELYSFNKWMQKFGKAALAEYQTLASVLRHNSTQPQKQVVEEPLAQLLKSLKSMPMEMLTNEQLGLLQYFEIARLVGTAGEEHVRQTVIKSDYDPATAAEEIQKNTQTLSNAINKMNQIGSALDNLSFLSELDFEEAGRATIRIQFKEEASISDVVEWKKWSAEWHDIIRGVALCVDESPENTKVVGADNGSLIMILSGTVGFVAALALITKHLSSIVKEGLVIANAIEDLRHKKILNKAIENSLKDQQTKITKEGVKTIVNEIKKALPNNLNGEQETALTKAVEKFLKFNELGGDVDFISPEEPEIEDDEAEQLASAKQILEIRETIEQIRSMRAEIKLLTDDSIEKSS